MPVPLYPRVRSPRSCIEPHRRRCVPVARPLVVATCPRPVVGGVIIVIIITVIILIIPSPLSVFLSEVLRVTDAVARFYGVSP